MKAITLWRPWALWVREGWKPIETRLHIRFMGLRGHRIAIHAGLKWDAGALTAALPWLTPNQIQATDHWRKTREGIGQIVCTALVEQARWLSAKDSEGALIDCEWTSRFGLFLTDIVPFNGPVVTGRQGMFSVSLYPIDEAAP